MTPFSPFKKYRHTLRIGYRLYLKKRESLPEEKRNFFYQKLKFLQEAIEKKDKNSAKKEKKALEQAILTLFPKTIWEKGRNFLGTIIFALCITILIRQVWWEHYRIPTGSMRPTLKEQDCLVVSKTSFGLNIPLATSHLYFDPALVQRNGIVVFTGEDMDIKDVDTLYFYIFPGKKQFVKRMIGKPGDTLYFYGGLIYGLDKDGHDISQELQLARLSSIDHVPFLQFDGKITTPSQPTRGIYAPVLIKQMNQPIARFSLSSFNRLDGEMLPPYKTANPSYFELWGIENFAMSRILSKEEALASTDTPLVEASFYLENRHHPNIKKLKLEKDMRGRMRPMFDLSSSLIPLEDKHLKTLFSNLYTVRFIVQNGKAYQYGLPKEVLSSPFLPSLSGVPNGTYEFYFGKAHQIFFQGFSVELPKDHPLYEYSPERIKLFYNLGMVFDQRFSPNNHYPSFLPLRYSYFRNGDFYTMGSILYEKEDKTLIHFLEEERTKAKDSSYTPFVDQGPPIKDDGTLNETFIREHGITVPEKMYLVLGDNHAVSADSREFGFVPEENLRGAPDFVFWPFGSRFGHPNQAPYPLFTAPRVFIWVLASLSIGWAIVWNRKRNKIPKL